MVVPLKASADSPLLEEIEIDLLLEGIYRYFGDDFRGYARAPLKRKLQALMRETGLCSISAVQDRALHNEEARAALLRALSSQPVALFHDAGYMLALREMLGSLLRSYADPKIWIAECAAAEDVFALAILLVEEGLYDRTAIFATSGSEELLREAEEGALLPAMMAEYDRHYRRGGGRRMLAEYCVEHEGRWLFAPRLRRNITWAHYSLASGTSFNEFQFILCRRTLAEFGNALQHRALALFHDSLAKFGILGVEGMPDPTCLPLPLKFKAVCPEHHLYRCAI